MSISINPIFPVIAAQGASPDLVLKPGTVIDAEVLKLLSDDLVRIAISGLSIEVFSEIPLRVGQALQLAVSQTPDGIRLAVVGRQSGPKAVASADAATLAPDMIVDVAATPPAAPSTNQPSRNELTPLERLAISAAAESAATQQESLAPLFANLDVVAASNALPPKLQQAVMQVLAQRTGLDQNLSGSDVRNALQKSGLFLEASLASGIISAPAGIPDLKAALIVLRQTLLSSLGATGAAKGPAASATAAQQPILPGAPGIPNLDAASGAVAPQPVWPAASETSAGDAAAPPHAAVIPTLAPSLPEIDVQEILLPQARVPVADDTLELGSTVRIVLAETPDSAGPRAATSGAALNLLQEVLSENLPEIANASPTTASLKGGRNDDIIVHTNTPPPPFRGALPSAQPVASPSIAPSAPLPAIAHHLLNDTDAAIARQTLLQVASLPDHVDIASARLDPAAPRWNFEIPFATLQGTAIAQFEVSRDGGGGNVEVAKRLWRARFSLDIEPAGPVHALVSLSGERTSVRIWAERPVTAAQLRAGVSRLSQALSEAELQPGDIVIRDGAPPQPAPAPAGHFLNRAL
ncbi:MAG TPA: flagellar hook-length control protein FliK [Bradyrhizobium sp.]|nr:flagellar hook-length control protein FliK [Bradyrhizobium sp.]